VPSEHAGTADAWGLPAFLPLQRHVGRCKSASCRQCCANIPGPSRLLYCGLLICDRLPICAEQLHAADSSSFALIMERRPVSSLPTPLVPHPIAAAASRNRPDFPSACAPAPAGGFRERAAETCAPSRRTKTPNRRHYYHTNSLRRMRLTSLPAPDVSADSEDDMDESWLNAMDGARMTSLPLPPADVLFMSMWTGFVEAAPPWGDGGTADLFTNSVAARDTALKRAGLLPQLVSHARILVQQGLIDAGTAAQAVGILTGARATQSGLHPVEAVTVAAAGLTGAAADFAIDPSVWDVLRQR